MKKTVPLVCVVDDDPYVREAVENLLRSEGFEVETFASAQRFMARARMEPPACLILDVNLPGLSGLDLQQELVDAGIPIPIIFLTGHGSIPMSVRAMKAGAMEFLTKPFSAHDLISAIQQGISETQPTELETKNDSSEIIGESSALRAVLNRIRVVAPTDSTVLILGETGTGKEVIAQEIHRQSNRKDKPLIRVNCASIPKELYESEFFGHVKGTFTGAFKDRIGRFESANGGTLFLDEIGEIPLHLQSKLLRALQEKQYERVGDDRTRRVDVRIIAATNRDLMEEIANCRFREDLYYRLNVFPLQVASLRERHEDIPLLAKHFVDRVVKETKCPKPHLTARAIATLQNYDWPGNIRELRNVIERAVILARGGSLEFDLPITDLPLPRVISAAEEVAGRQFFTEPEMLRLERDNLLVVLEKTGWKIKGADGAAELLGVKPTTLLSRIKKMGLRREEKAMARQAAA
jgi:DNA-binding NtrC family response regulator